MDWTQAIITIVTVLIAIVSLFVWLRNDIKRLEDKVDALGDRLRQVESEQSRVAGLLEGLGIAGKLTSRDI
ncbi:MAG: hypothetical protein OXN94_18245 [Chloroflexota bacterium]|nr:hypothetical protein [Chloroflexota bacterium]MDE2859794.1 hypothetical protein [Chloroflexota bacterium]MDE2950870.1 hypothetical protein [Chloroflexota bacterium]